MARPDFDGGAGDVQAVRNLVECQHAYGAESRVSRAEVVTPADMFDHAAVERLSGAREITACVQHRRDGDVGVLVEELIDECHDLGAGFTQLPCVQGAGEREGCRRAAPEADVGREPLHGFHKRHILHQQADHPFSFTIGRVRVVPESWKVARQGKNPRTRLVVHGDAGAVSLSLIGLLRVDDLLQGAIPLGF